MHALRFAPAASSCLACQALEASLAEAFDVSLEGGVITISSSLPSGGDVGELWAALALAGLADKQLTRIAGARRRRGGGGGGGDDSDDEEDEDEEEEEQPLSTHEKRLLRMQVRAVGCTQCDIVCAVLHVHCHVPTTCIDAAAVLSLPAGAHC